jgi:hypothetical protein
MSDDPNIRAAQYRAREIETQITNAQARLAENNLYGNEQDAAACIQEIANLGAEKTNLHALYANYVASQTPPAPRQLSPEEEHAKPIQNMTYADVYRMAKNDSKLGVDDNRFREGIAEVQRRRAYDYGNR